MTCREARVQICFSVLICLLATSASADMFDDAKNLKVLPETTTAEELRAMMRGISMGTGNRCSACHVGEVEADLSTYDFSLDDKKKKAKARKMIQLTDDINAALAAAFADSPDSIVPVTCATCHRGQSKPEMIQDVLLRKLRSDGLQASLDQYRQLRERYYGGYTFDFSERMLMRLAETVSANNELDTAIAYVQLNLEYFPQSSRTFVLRAQIYTELGDIAAARNDYERALEIEPQSRWIRQQLDNLN